MKVDKTFIRCLILSWGYGLFNLGTNILEFKESYFKAKVNNSFSFFTVVSNSAFLFDLICYFFWFFMLYTFIAIISFLLASAARARLNVPDRSKALFYYLVLFIIFYAIAIINAFVYPINSLIQPGLGHWMFLFVSAGFFLSMSTASFVNWFKASKSSTIKRALVLSVLIGFFVIANTINFSNLFSKKNESPDLPNIFIIGVDSLRPDLIPAARFEKKSTTADCEHLNRFLEKSCVFPNAVTAFGRTFPSWISLLTGKYPIHNKARFNLIDQEPFLKNEVFLSEYLKQKGYTTVYASDEKRFSNVDDRHGFDIVSGPPAGVADFLIAPVFQTPLINLLVNSSLGRFMFPYNHANRAIASTYNPDTFVRLLEKDLDAVPESPVFMALHLCLAHWPYSWANNKIDGGNSEIYLESLSRVDQQFSTIVKMLEKRFFDNALVFVVSDHGESLCYLENGKVKYLNGEENFVNPTTKDQFDVNEIGHGSYVADRGQFNVVLGVRGFGKAETRIGKMRQDVSLIDIFPTIVNFFQDPLDRFDFDGVSLKNWILSSEQKPGIQDRHFFIESGISKVFAKGSTTLNSNNIKRMVSSGIDYYRLTREGKIVIKDTKYAALMQEKQYAVIKGEKSVVILPEEEKINVIGLDYAANEWTALNPIQPGIDNDYGFLFNHLIDMYKGEPVIDRIISETNWHQVTMNGTIEQFNEKPNG